MLYETRDLTKKRILFAPESFKIATIGQLRSVCNGCGAANAKFDFIPDTIYFTYVGYACNIHDWMYYIGKTINDKDEADRVFLNNLCRLIKRDNSWWKPKFLMRRRAKKYYLAVKYFGGDAFWDNNE